MPLYAQRGLIVVVFEGWNAHFLSVHIRWMLGAEAHLRDGRVNLAIGIIVAEDLLVPRLKPMGGPEYLSIAQKREMFSTRWDDGWQADS